MAEIFAYREHVDAAVVRCLEAGANDYIAKPIDVQMLLSLLRVWMPK